MSMENVPVQDPIGPACFIYEHVDYKGKTLVVTGNVPNLVSIGFNDAASSMIVMKGQWRIYEHIDFHGVAILLGPGCYKNFADFGIPANDCISSIKLVAA